MRPWDSHSEPWASLSEERTSLKYPSAPPDEKLCEHSQTTCEQKVSKGNLKTVNPGDKPEGTDNVCFRVGDGDLTPLRDCHSDNSRTCEEDPSDGCLSAGN